MFSNLTGAMQMLHRAKNTSSLLVALPLLQTAFGKCFSKVSGLEKIRERKADVGLGGGSRLNGFKALLGKVFTRTICGA